MVIKGASWTTMTPYVKNLFTQTLTQVLKSGKSADEIVNIVSE